MFKNPIIKNILSALAVAGGGFILLNLAFMFDFIFQSAVRGFIQLFTPVDLTGNFGWFPPMLNGSFVIIIGLISWLVFQSKIKTLYKAIYMTVPAAVVLVTVGMFLYRWPAASYSLGTLITIGTLYYFYRAKLSWLYYFAVILVGITLALMGILGVDI